MVKLGRDYTNCLIFDYLDKPEQRAAEKGELNLASMDALALGRAKQDIEQQIKMTRELGMEHVELDANPPNPYLDFNAQRRQAIREVAQAHEVNLSLNLPSSHEVGASVFSPQEDNRVVAVDLHKRCIQFAADVGAKYVNMHPGSAPLHPELKESHRLIHDSLLRSLVELGKFADDRGLVLHLENNTAFDGIYSEVEDCLAIIKEAKAQGVEVYFNFDIGHWLTRADFAKQIPDLPEKALEPIPPDFLKELHLNDYVLDEKMLNPPLHLGWGLLQRGNLQRYARLVKRKGVETVVLETTLKNIAQVLDHEDLLKRESEYVRDIFEE